MVPLPPIVPLQFVGLPGGPELLIVLLVFLLLFGVPVLLAAGAAVWLVRRRDDDDVEERIRDLEAEIAKLRDQLKDE
jgi:sec-independent protein translocase protein TatA